MRLAIGHATLAAAAGLFSGLAVGELPVNLAEILRARGCVPLLGHFPADGDEFQHLLRGHGLRSWQILPGAIWYSGCPYNKSQYSLPNCHYFGR